MGLQCVVVIIRTHAVVVWWPSCTYAPSSACTRMAVVVHVGGDRCRSSCNRDVMINFDGNHLILIDLPMSLQMLELVEASCACVCARVRVRACVFSALLSRGIPTICAPCGG